MTEATSPTSFSFSLQLPVHLPPVFSPLPPPPPTTVAEIDSFKALLFRDTNTQRVEDKCRELLQQYANDWASLYALFQVIRYTRETLLERDLTYLQMCVWHETLPLWATHALSKCVYSYGCWKDIKYLCQYCKDKYNNQQDHPLILYAICLLDYQLKHDFDGTVSPRAPHSLSYAAKWTPREKSKHGWIFTILSVGYFGYLSSAVTLEQQTKALNKSKMHLRKILSTLNKHLDTVEIKQCSNRWEAIRHIPQHAAFKYHRAWVRHSVEVSFHQPAPSGKYPYANIKSIADRLNKDYELDSDVSTEPVAQYRDHWNRLVKTFFGTYSGQSLSILDMATLTAHDLNQAIGCSCVECDGVVILNSDGKYRFVAFSSSDFCDRLQEVSVKIVSSPAVRPDLSPLQTVSLFMDRCYRETNMSESDRKKIKILVFSRVPVKELETIFPRGLFQLKL
jgi:hypothetical protein